MKWLIYTLYALFLSLMVATFIMAGKYSDELVETGYYEKSKDYFSNMEEEEREGVSIMYPETLKAGENEIVISVSTGGVPVTAASGNLVVTSISRRKSTGEFRIIPMENGKYSAKIGNLEPGRYILNLEVSTGEKTWRRRWFLRVD